MSSQEEAFLYPTIGILGAGLSGLCAAIQLKNQLGIESFMIFDENKEVGGTWLVNTYPGCKSDVASHFYSYSFEPNPNWSAIFAPQSEILEYIKRVARKYDLYPHIKFRHRLKRAIWLEVSKKWEIIVVNLDTGEETTSLLDILISGIGGFRLPFIPPVFESFKGPKMHSAEWDDSIEIDGKIVGVVGSGCSAIQIIPAIVDRVEKLYVFHRRPGWVLPKPDIKLSNWLNRVIDTIPGFYQAIRVILFWSMELSHNIYLVDSLINKIVTLFAKYNLEAEFGPDENLKSKVRPNYTLGCKRLTPSNNYYPALKKPNVRVSASKIEKLKGNSIFTEDGRETQVDVLILGTGFRVQDYFAPLEIIGRDGVNMMDLWMANGPSTYQGMCTHHCPNAFFIIGPNGAPGYTSAIFTIEIEVNWIIQVIKEMIRKESREVRVKEWAEKMHMEGVHKDFKKTIWGTEDCGSYLVDNRGVVTTYNPKSALSYWWGIRKVDFNHILFL